MMIFLMIQRGTEEKCIIRMQNEMNDDDNFSDRTNIFNVQ